MPFCPSLDLLLDSVKLLQGNNCLMGIFYVVHWQFAVILPSVLGEMAFGERFLQQQISGIAVISQNPHNTGLPPFFVPAA